MTELPKGWKQAHIGELASKIGSGATPKGGAKSYKSFGTPLVRSMNIHFDGVRDRGLAFIDDDQAKKLDNVQVETDDVLLNITGASIGRVALAPERYAGARVNQHVAIIRTVEGLDPSFLSRYLASPEAQVRILEENYGVTRQALTKGMIETFPVTLPPLLEQRRIVAKLDGLSERSSAAREHLTHVITLTARAKQAILASAFRGQLTSEWRSSKEVQRIGNEMVEDLREQRHAWWISEEQKKREAKGQSTCPGAWTKKYRAPQEIGEEDAIFDVPKSWAWIASEEVVAPGAEIAYGIVQPGPKLDEGVPYVRGLDIVDGVIQTHQLLKTSPEIALKYARASLAEGDILLGIIRATKVAVVPKEISGANITQGTARFRPSNSIRTKFLARWLEGPDAQKWLHAKYRGIDMPGLNLRDVRRCPVPLAPIEEQDEIIRCIETAFARIDRLTEEASRASHLLDRLDERLLAKAFQGELVPQDPDDEPAEALLERIREAKAAAPKPKRTRRTKTA